MKAIFILLLATVLHYHCRAQLKDTVTNKPGKQLQTVTITAKSPIIRQEADRIIYDLQADAQSKVSSVLDMMRKVPYLSVDANDNILLKGSTGYKIFVNGRPSGFISNNPKEVLRSMPASTIKSIEVITNPSARYDAEGLAGIINIITIKQLYDGYKGSVNVSEKGPVGGPGVGGSFTFKQARFGMSAMAGINRYIAPETIRHMERTGIGMYTSRLQQHTTSKSNSRNAYAGLELSYEADSLNLISCQLNWNNGKSTGASTQTTALTSGNDQQYYQLDNNNNSNDMGLDATINYQLGFKANKDQLLTFSYQYLKYKSSLYNNIELYNTVNYTMPDYHQYNSETYTDHTAQVDYVQPIRKMSIEGGLKGIFRKNESDFEYRSQNPVTGEYETDLVRSNVFDNTRDILSAYNSYDYQNAGWQIKAGIRVEQTMIKIHYSQGLVPLQQQYLNVLPRLLINRKIKNNNSLGFSFSKRIQRPSTTELNPFVDRSDPNFQKSGNPYLRPITSNVYELSYMKSAKATINISIGGMFFNHVFSAFPFYAPATNTSITRYENYGKGRVLKTNISINYPITEKWNATLNADIRHITVDGIANNIAVKNSGFGVYVYASSGYHIKGWQVNADITYKMGGILLPLGRTNGFIASSFSMGKDVIHSKLTASVAVSNPFTKYRYVDETITSDNFAQASHNQSYYRRFTISINYRFGKLKEEIRRNKRGINNGDAGN